MKNLLATILMILTLQGVAQQKPLQWQTNMDKAIQISQQSGKPIMLFFTGSDWCGWCKRLQQEVFLTSDFTAWSKKVVLVEVDFPKRTTQTEELKKQNRQLQQMFGVRGYPTVWFVIPEKNSNGQINFSQLGQTGYVQGGPKAWIDGANKILENKK